MKADLRLELTLYFVLVFTAGALTGYEIGQQRYVELALSWLGILILIVGIALTSRKTNRGGIA